MVSVPVSVGEMLISVGPNRQHLAEHLVEHLVQRQTHWVQHSMPHLVQRQTHTAQIRLHSLHKRDPHQEPENPFHRHPSSMPGRHVSALQVMRFNFGENKKTFKITQCAMRTTLKRNKVFVIGVLDTQHFKMSRSGKTDKSTNTKMIPVTISTGPKAAGPKSGPAAGTKGASNAPNAPTAPPSTNANVPVSVAVTTIAPAQPKDAKGNKDTKTAQHQYYHGCWYEGFKNDKPGSAGSVWVQYDTAKTKAMVFFKVDEGKFKDTQVKFDMTARERETNKVDIPDLRGKVLGLVDVNFEKDAVAKDKPTTESSGRFIADAPLMKSEGRWFVHATTKDRTPDADKWKDNYSMSSCSLM